MKSTRKITKELLVGGLLLVFTFVGQADAQTSVEPPQGLMHWWPLDGNASDIVGGKHGEILGGTFVDGQVGQAFQLSAFGHGIQAQNVDIPEEFTIQAWIFPKGQAFFGTFHPGPGPITEFFDAVSFFQHPSETNLHVAFRNTAGVIITATNVGMVVPNVWNHGVLTYSKSTGIARFYRNGVETGSHNFGSLSLVPSVDFYIGHRASGSYDQVGVTYNGIIDEVGIYNRALTAAEIAAIFVVGSAGKCKEVGPVELDIKPGSFPNSINPKSKGVVPVAILTTSTFDATAVDSTTVLFGATGAEAAPVHAALEDVDGDEDTDMILHFNTQETGIVCGDTSASLTGETFSGQVIERSDSIKTAGCK